MKDATACASTFRLDTIELFYCKDYQIKTPNNNLMTKITNKTNTSNIYFMLYNIKSTEKA